MPKKQLAEPEAAAIRREVLHFLLGLLRGEGPAAETGVKERLKAAELLGKGCGAFAAEEDEMGQDWKVEITVIDQ